MKKTLLPVLVLALVSMCAAVLAQPPDRALQVRNRALTVQWTDPETRLPPFDKVMLAPVELQFRAVAPMSGPTGYTGSRTDFPVGEQEQKEIADVFNRIFREELGASTHFSLVMEPGPGVLLIKPALRDIVSRIPPEEPVGRSYVYTDTVGEATLVLDFINPVSGATLGTAMDRRTAEQAGGAGDFGGTRANKVGAGQEVRRLARRWGMSLEQRVEQLYFEAKPK